MSLSLMTLNIEGARHLERVARTMRQHQPDVVCLQEVLEPDFNSFCDELGYEGVYAKSAYVSISNEDSRLIPWGLSILSRQKILRHSCSCYSEDQLIRPLIEPNDPRRFVLSVEISVDGAPLTIATTHFTWSPLGQISDLQKADFRRLKAELDSYGEYVLCGDFNSPRGREMFSKFLDELALRDNVPRTVTSTIDGEYHHAGQLEIVVDTVFSTAQINVHSVSPIRGVSDHKAILCMVSRHHPPAIPDA